ncbi:putative Se/S carrier-like protein [uncultured Parolsenella sp.]|nr:putative Se/S carrier-like protein [uncultured Parolsenella sp.]
MRYVATFFSHFGATRFRRLCCERRVACRLAPVPRSLSSG